jgi:uncharacterized protein YfaT (DUF1175 family)
LYILAQFKYDTIDEFTSDMKLLAKNALLFNGSSSPYTADANSLLQYTEDQINQDMMHQLPDTLRLLEETVKNRSYLCVYLPPNI